MVRQHLLLLICAVTLAACQNPDSEPEKTVSEALPGPQQPLFTRLGSQATGIDFANNLIENLDNNMNVLSFENYFTGSGIAVGDVNNDGLPDLFFSGNTVSNRLYINQGDFKFTDITQAAGLEKSRYWSNGVTMADVNQDGWLDLYVAVGGPVENVFQRKNRYYESNGDGTFTEKADELGIADENWSMHSAFLDYDRDGDLDLFVLNHTVYWRRPVPEVIARMKNPADLARATNNLYRNNGDGTFTKVTKQAGVEFYGYGLGLVVQDINEDGWPDIYVANDYTVPDRMFINNKNGTFTDQQKERTRQITWYGMGADIADINNDGHPEIGVVDMATADHFRGKTLMAPMDERIFNYMVDDLDYQHQYMFNSLQLNNGNGTFSNIASAAGVAKSEWSWSSLFADFDNDGYKDYLITNGILRYPRDNDFRLRMKALREANGGRVPDDQRAELYNMMPQIKLPNELYRNNGDLTFTNMAKSWGVDDPSYSHGAAYADLDNDGDLDMIVCNTNDEPFVYRNEATDATTNNFLQVQLQSPDPKFNLLNTKVTIEYGGKQQYQEFTRTRGFLSSVPNLLQFGLGNASEVDNVRVEWPDGTTQNLGPTKAGQRLIVQPADQREKTTAPQPTEGLFAPVDKALGINFTHRENDYHDYGREVLLPHSQSRLGPFVIVGDANGDGLDDVFVGGAKGQAGVLYLQQESRQFAKAASQPWSAAHEDMDGLFFDADGDGDNDLYIVSGGGGDFAENDPLLQDRLYLNDGSGKFTLASKALPEMPASGMRVKAADYDGDGDLDLFVGGRTTPGKYPFPARSYLLQNQGDGTFADVTAAANPDLSEPGMVTDLLWTDFTADGKPDLIVCGEWMPLRFFVNDGSTFSETQAASEDLSGWWYSLTEADVDNDGDMDLIAGNIGLNTKFTPKKDKPLNIYCNDFDQNGTYDIVIGKYYNGKEVPLRGRQCSSEQMPGITDKFPTYKSFAEADLPQILGNETFESAFHAQANHFKSTVWINDGGTFKPQPLPVLAQIAPINRILTADFNSDGNTDLLIAGNMYNAEVETPRYDAGNGLLLYGDGTGNFTPATVSESGFFAPGDVKDMEWLDANTVLVTNNNGRVQIFRLKQQPN